MMPLAIAGTNLEEPATTPGNCIAVAVRPSKIIDI